MEIMIRNSRLAIPGAIAPSAGGTGFETNLRTSRGRRTEATAYGLTPTCPPKHT